MFKSSVAKQELWIKYIKHISNGKWHGIVVSMMAYGPEDLGLIPRLAKVHNDVIFLLGVFMIQFNLI